mmetsp:Transcript_1872/g.3006  ORF Transcript_1872/g.3006 Transcript_1872/m.3006 type:complete len:176 (+) Transcript_1872:563-1090(+)
MHLFVWRYWSVRLGKRWRSSSLLLVRRVLIILLFLSLLHITISIKSMTTTTIPTSINSKPTYSNLKMISSQNNVLLPSMKSHIKSAWNGQNNVGNNRLKNTNVGLGYVIGLSLTIVGLSLCNVGERVKRKCRWWCRCIMTGVQILKIKMSEGRIRGDDDDAGEESVPLCILYTIE